VSADSYSVSVIVSTYEWPEALDVVIRALAAQEDDRFEVIVADDGSGPQTSAVVSTWRRSLGDRMRHVRQPDEGWRLSRVRNLGALHARGRILVFLDGDCIVRRGFMEALNRAALPGWFLSSKRLHLSESLSKRVLEERLPVWNWSAFAWVLRAPGELMTSHREAGTPGVLIPLRDRRRPWREGQPEFLPPYGAYGFFLALSRADFEAVNGFDMRFARWGGEDKDIAGRLRGRGLRCGWPGPGATMLHLWHPRRDGTPVAERTGEGGPEHAPIGEVYGLRELREELRATGTSST